MTRAKDRTVKGPGSSTCMALIGREARNVTITSSPPPKVGCDRTVTNGYSPPESNHGFYREYDRAQEVFSSSQMSRACDRTVKTSVAARSRASTVWDRDYYKVPAGMSGYAHDEFSPPPTSKGYD